VEIKEFKPQRIGADKRRMWLRFLEELCHDEQGQDLIEYALLLAFLALVAVAILGGMGTNVQSLWNGVSNALSDAITQTGWLI
jgi:Flp pilus assembly pilin Flp